MNKFRNSVSTTGFPGCSVYGKSMGALREFRWHDSVIGSGVASRIICACDGAQQSSSGTIPQSHSEQVFSSSESQ